MTFYRLKLVFITLLLFIAGCTEKDELTLPVTIDLKVNIFSHGFDYGEFDKGWIGIQKIQFEGTREAGGDIFFETDSAINFPMLEFGDALKWEGELSYATISSFEIPQGIYNKMTWDISLKKIATDTLIGDNDTNSLNPGIVVKGKYYYDDWWYWWDLPPPDGWINSMPFIVAIEATELLSFNSYVSPNSSSIALTNNKDYKAVLYLDFPYAFSIFSRESFEQAEISGDSLHQKVIISSNKNKNLYETIVYRLATSAKAYVY